MGKKEIEDKFLEEVAGGAISEGPYGVSFLGGRIVMSVSGRSTRSYSVDQFSSAFTSQGIPEEKVQELVDLIKSDKAFTPKDVKELTDIDFAFTRG